MNIRRVDLQCIIVMLLIGYAADSAAQSGTDCLIKGIIGSSGQKMYLIPGHYLYDKVTPDLNKGEQWFCEAAGAERAGFVFVPDPTNPNLRPQEATPTPPPTATPEPQPTATIESTEANTGTPEVMQATGTSTSPEPQSEVTEPPTPEPPIAKPIPVETAVSESASEAPSNEPVSQPDMPGMPLEQLGPIVRLLPPEAQAQLQQLPPEALALIALILAWIPVVIGIGIFIGIMVIIVRWKLFVKAGEPGWAAIIPIYAQVLMLKIAGFAWWWILIGIVPVVNLAFMIVWIFIRPFKTAEHFGKGFLYGLGLFLFPLSPVFWLHLAFSNAEYTGP